MMIRRMVLAMAALGLSLSVAAAQPEAPPHSRQSPRVHARMMEKLNLNDQQKTQMEKLRASFQKKNIDTQARIRSLQVDLRSAALADNPDRGAIEKIVGSISELQNQAKLALVDHLFAVREILTPEQQKIWKSELMQIAGEMRGRQPMMGRMRDRRGEE